MTDKLLNFTDMETKFYDYEFKFMELKDLENGQLFFYQTKPYRVKDMQITSCSCRQVVCLTDNWNTVYPLSMKVSAVINEKHPNA